jgi:hypothetical protein
MLKILSEKCLMLSFLCEFYFYSVVLLKLVYISSNNTMLTLVECWGNQNIAVILFLFTSWCLFCILYLVILMRFIFFCKYNFHCSWDLPIHLNNSMIIINDHATFLYRSCSRAHPHAEFQTELLNAMFLGSFISLKCKIFVYNEWEFDSNKIWNVFTFTILFFKLLFIRFF